MLQLQHNSLIKTVAKKAHSFSSHCQGLFRPLKKGVVLPLAIVKKGVELPLELIKKG